VGPSGAARPDGPTGDGVALQLAVVVATRPPQGDVDLGLGFDQVAQVVAFSVGTNSVHGGPATSTTRARSMLLLAASRASVTYSGTSAARSSKRGSFLWSTQACCSPLRAYEQDPERVARWKAEEYPAIREAAAEQGATILLGDEAAIRTDYHAGTTWAPVGRTRGLSSNGTASGVTRASDGLPNASGRRAAGQARCLAVRAVRRTTPRGPSWPGALSATRVPTVVRL
jgi:hypothetical protein